MQISKIFKMKTIIVLAIIISVTIPILRPIGLPLPISKYTQEVYDYLEDLPPRSVVLFHNGGNEGQWAYGAPELVAIGSHIQSLNLNVVYVSFHYAGPSNTDRLLELIGTGGKEYGEDYVRLGFIPGYPQSESALAALGSDLQKMCPVDYYGTPIEEIDMMENIHSYKDFDLIIDLGGIATGEMFIRQWLDVPMLGIWAANYKIEMNPYYEQGIIKGILVGIRGVSEYEYLLKKPGQAIIMQDAISLYHVLMIVFLVIGNIEELRKKYGVGRNG